MNKEIIYAIILILSILSFILLEILVTTLGLVAILIILVFMKKIETRSSILIFFIYLVFILAYVFYLEPSIIAAKTQPPILSKNWFEMLNWIKDNTKECAVVATYWDPGHFITGIARRAVVFDGASQGATTYVPLDEFSGEEGLVTEEYDNGAVQIKLYKSSDSLKGNAVFDLVSDNNTKGVEIRARIKDIAITLFTDNETQAIEILKDYAKPGCEDEVYYIASSDLIGKSTWWSYFSTWDPVNKGRATPMQFVNLQQSRPLIGQNTITNNYCCLNANNENYPIVIFEQNNSLTPYLQVRNQFIKISKLFFFDENGQGVLAVNQDGQFPGTIWLDPSKQLIVYMPAEVENSMFTRMFFYHGQGLEHFEFINDWGGEVKLFKVKF